MLTIFWALRSVKDHNMNGLRSWESESPAKKVETGCPHEKRHILDVLLSDNVSSPLFDIYEESSRCGQERVNG